MCNISITFTLANIAVFCLNYRQEPINIKQSIKELMNPGIKADLRKTSFITKVNVKS